MTVERERSQAEQLLADHPLQSLFSNVHYSSDGRITHRSSGTGGPPIYGTDPATWRQMIQTYQFRIGLLVQGALLPAFTQIANEHNLTVADFEIIVRRSSIVPTDRVALYAQGLYYGYTSQYPASIHILLPQIENLVRVHLANSGVATSRIDRGIEQELGLSALMDKPEAEEVFGEDTAFELRALLCGPIGPNLRNEIAHGLADNDVINSMTGFYLWWFALRLVYVNFWNVTHNTEATDAREPARAEE
jgi:hypothetical protein